MVSGGVQRAPRGWTRLIGVANTLPMGEEMLPQPAPLAAPPVYEPKRLKVFGIIHIVLGGLGLLYGLFQIAMLPFQEKMTRATAQGQPEEFIEAQIQMQKDMAGFSWLTAGLWIAVATQAGRTVDEDFPGGAYVFAPDGRRVHATPDWQPGAVYLGLDLATAEVVEL